MPKNAQIITRGWVFNVKKEFNGELFKARLVANGFEQEHGQNYGETYAPIVILNSVWLVFESQLDAKCAFLNGKIDYPVYFKLREVSL